MRHWPRRGAARWGAVLVLGLALAPLWLAPTAGATGRTAADETSDDIRISVTALGPAALSPGSTLRVTARVVNASDGTLQGVGARLRLDPTAVTSRAGVAAFLQGTSDAEVGQVVVPSLVDVADQLLPGQSAQVQIEVPVAELGLPDSFGVHALTLELRVAEPDGTRRTAGSVRTLVVDRPSSNVPKVRVAWVWPLVGVPGRTPEGVVPKAAADQLALDLEPSGRLGALLDAASGRPVSVLVDGALLEDVRSLATGRGLAPGAQPDPNAETWLSALAAEAVRTGSDVRALPYADPDLTAVVRAGLGADLPTGRTKGADAASAVLDHAVPSAPAWPVDGRTNRGTLSTLAAQDVTTVVLSSAGLTDQDVLPATPDAVAALSDHPTMTAITSDATLSGILDGGPAELGGLVLARQRLLAETAMIAAERPGDPRSVVGTPDRRWSPGSAWAGTVADLSAPWVQQVTLRALQDEPGDAPARSLRAYGEVAVQAEVSPAQLATVARDQEALDSFAAAVEDPKALMDDYEGPLLTAQSSAWRGDGAESGRAYTAALSRRVDETVNSVRLLPRGQVTLSSRTSIVPFAVQNSFDQTVRVRISMTSTPAVRLTSDSSEVFAIPAGRTASVDVPAQATTDATFPVVARLLTPDGDPLGQPVRFTLRATGYGQVARVVVGGALVVLAVAVVLRVARRIRAARAAVGGTLDP